MTTDLASGMGLRAVSLLAAAAILGWLGSAPARAQDQQPAQGQGAQSGASSSSSSSSTDEGDSGSDDDDMMHHMGPMMEHMGQMGRMGTGNMGMGNMGMMRGNGRGMPGPMMGMMAGGMGGKGAVFIIRSGQNRIVVRCAENEPMRACVDAAAVLMDKARSGSGATQP